MRLNKNILFIPMIYALMAASAHAVVYDAADHLDGGDFSIGANAEVLLSNPSSEGVELRPKYGVTDTLNTQAILGMGSKYRKFRIGVNNVLAIFPDADGQLGVSALLGGLYLRRENRGVFIASAGPMIHKRFYDWTVPFNMFFAWPFAIELDSGRYYTGSQLVLGSILEWSAFEVPLALGVGLGKMETYVAAGLTIRFGERSAGGSGGKKAQSEERELPAKRKVSSTKQQPVPAPNADGSYTTVD